MEQAILAHEWGGGCLCDEFVCVFLWMTARTRYKLDDTELNYTSLRQGRLPNSKLPLKDSCCCGLFVSRQVDLDAISFDRPQ